MQVTMEQGMSVSKHAAHLDCSVAFAAESARLFCSEGHISSLQDGSLSEPLAWCEPLPELDGESNGCRRSRSTSASIVNRGLVARAIARCGLRTSC